MRAWNVAQWDDAEDARADIMSADAARREAEMAELDDARLARRAEPWDGRFPDLPTSGTGEGYDSAPPMAQEVKR